MQLRIQEETWERIEWWLRSEIFFTVWLAFLTIFNWHFNGQLWLVAICIGAMLFNISVFVVDEFAPFIRLESWPLN